ncbi:hypothetical protein ACFWGC_23745 [Cytobacillus pseudoceanisediminis]
MSIIGFWGTVHGQVSTTSNVIAISTMLALENQIKTMITQTQSSHSTLESSLVKGTNDGGLLTFSDTGLDALERLARSNRLTPDKVSDYTLSLLKGRLELLAGAVRPDASTFDNISEVIDLILAVAKECYELCFIDAHSGTKNDITKRVLKESDLIVVNLNQNIHVLNRFFQKDDYLSELDSKPYIIVISQYDPKSHLTVKNIQRKYKCKAPIFTVPYNTNFRDACNQQNVMEYFLRARNFTKKHPDYFFVNEIRKIANAIVKQTLPELAKNNEITKGVS